MMKLEPIEFKQVTQRHRRNLVATAFLIIIIRGLNLQIEQFPIAGLQISGLSADSIVIGLMVMLIYSACNYVIRCWEEFCSWKLQQAHMEPFDSEDWNKPVALTKEFKEIAPRLIKIVQNDKSLPKLSATDVQKILNLADNLDAYASGLKRYSVSTKLRLWGWEWGAPAAAAALALFFTFYPWGTGLFSTWSLPSP